MRVLLFVVAVGLAGCSKSDPAPTVSPAAAAPTAKDPATARAWIAGGATVIDVRTPDEYAEDHLPAAVNIPVDQVPGRLPEIAKLVGDKTKRVVVYCASGARAATAKKQLDAAGYTSVVNGGGFDDLH